MNTNECWLNMHAYCSAPVDCDCLCHVAADELLDELEIVLDNND